MHDFYLLQSVVDNYGIDAPDKQHGTNERNKAECDNDRLADVEKGGAIRYAVRGTVRAVQNVEVVNTRPETRSLYLQTHLVQPFGTRQHQVGDRKSTRLNSSHQIISY